MAAYLEDFALAPGSELVLKIDRLEHLLGQGGERLRNWLAEHPDDLQVRLVHASQLQQRGAAGDAIEQYEALLDQRGRNPVVLNNLAWLYFEKGDERALGFAKEAHDLAPDTPEILDTYGWILAGRGQREQGYELLTKASELAPKNPDISYHLASVLAESGHADQALARINQMLNDNPEFALRKDALELQAKLQR